MMSVEGFGKGGLRSFGFANWVAQFTQSSCPSVIAEVISEVVSKDQSGDCITTLTTTRSQSSAARKTNP